jgi:hypothetical protein
MKDFIAKYNVKVAIVGTAVVLSSVLGKCSYDYATGEVEGSTNPVEVIETLKPDAPEEASPEDSIESPAPSEN